MANYLTQSQVEYDRALRTLYWDALDTAVTTTPQPNTDALQPSDCDDSEAARRKHGLVVYAVVTGITDDANVPEVEACQS